MITYRDITAYWECPRAWAYGRRYEQPYMPPAMLRGHLAHKALQGHWSGVDVEIAAKDALNQYGMAVKTMHPDDAKNVNKDAAVALRTALQLVRAYVKKSDQGVTLMAEERLEWGGVGGTPDRVALHGDKLVLHEVKTSEHPNAAFLDMSGQADYYALLLQKVRGRAPDFVAFDVLTPDYLYRHMRPPRLDAGAYMLRTAETLAAVEPQRDAYLATPHFTYGCTKCPFFRACRVRELGGDDEEVLLQHFIPRVEG